MYTSPHVLKICERIIVDGGMISEPEFARAIGAVVAVTQRARVANPTYFEVLTAAAFHYFAMKGVEVAVVEAGMGGRLDSTNVITPEVVGITSISLDHQSQLGSRLDAIAAEKAGVIKKGVPVVSAPQAKEVRKVIEDAAMTASAPLRFSTENTDYSYRFEHSRVMGRHARICFSTARSRFEHVHVPLAGEHQATNCGLALSMLDVLKDRGVPVDDQRAMEGLANVKLLARMQIVAENPRVLCDGAHNASSVDALMRAIGQNVTYDSMVVIFGCQKDKDISGMIRRIQVGADKLIFTPIRSPRTADPNDLAALYVEHSGKMAQVADSLDDAMQSALGAVGQEDLICVTGSFYVAAEAIRKFGQEKQLQN